MGAGSIDWPLLLGILLDMVMGAVGRAKWWTAGLGAKWKGGSAAGSEWAAERCRESDAGEQVLGEKVLWLNCSSPHESLL